MSLKMNVLIIDDDEDDFYITSQYLKEIKEFDVQSDWSYNIVDAQQKLASNGYDIYLLDYRLGAKTGLELLREAIAAGCTKPIVLLTGKGTAEIDKLAVESGAYDYLVKSDINADKLERCLRYASERYKSFKLITDNEKKYRLIFENAISFIFTCDKDLNFLECNPASEYFLGYSPIELKGNTLIDMVEESDRRQINKLVSAKKNISNLNVKFKAKSGEIKTGNLSLNYFEVQDPAGSWQGIIYDETMRIQAEQAKIQSEKLEGTHRLVTTLAHEIRNPLTNIGLSVGGIIDEGINDSQEAFANIIKRSSARINDIITELLNSSRELELKFDLIDLNSFLNDVLHIAQDSIQLKNIQLRVALCDFPVIKPIDREKFKIALLNLIFNAVEASDKVDSYLSVELEQKLENTVLVIEDNGSGIKEEDLNKLFEPYFTTKKTGMGLGLVSTLNIIKSHKAQIEVQSKVGKGTTFRIVFDN